MRRCGETIEDLIRSEEKNKGNTLIGIIQTANASLSKIESPSVEKLTMKSDWTPEKLRSENATLYIVLRTGMADQYAALLRIILGVHLKELLAKLPPKDAPPILFMLDEMPQLRRMKPIEDTLDLGRQYGLRLWMFAQSLGQITEHYRNAGSFISKCAVQCYMNPTSVDGTAQKISQMLGNRESVIDGRPVPLIEMTDLTGPKYADKIIIFGSGSKPAVVRKDYAYKNPDLVKYIGQ
jgi:type IV secretion system protein VirD4